ncbi:MAG: hypothetical protein ACRD96_19820 [Bryobacteraceae bacterium]
MNINREHPEFIANQAAWTKYRDLYAGGEQLRRNAPEYLVRRSKEPNEVYQERVSRVFYENYAGSIIDWFAATLMRREPVLSCDGPDETARGFLGEFAEDCDLRGTKLADFFRQQLVHTLVYGRTWIAVEFPRAAGPAANRADEDASGQSRAYLVEYTPDEAINWEHGEDGNLAWIVLRTTRLHQSEEGWKQITRWLRYDREEFAIFEQAEGEKKPRSIDQGRHGLAEQGRVPVFEMKVSGGLWLMNKAALLQLEHFNKSNALSWALTMGLFAMPVVYSEREWSQIVGESYYIQLGPEDRFGWTEPEGHVYQIAADNLVRLKDEIYRVCYLMMQAGTASSANLTQSGLSKQRDFSITHEVLRAFGDTVKESMKQVLRAVVAARRDEVCVDVSGLDEFDIGDFGAELDEAQKLLGMGIESPTLKKEVFKKLAAKYFADARQDLKNKIAAEIEASFPEVE